MRVEGQNFASNGAVWASVRVLVRSPQRVVALRCVLCGAVESTRPPRCVSLHTAARVLDGSGEGWRDLERPGETWRGCSRRRAESVFFPPFPIPQLAVLRAQLGSLNHVKRLVKATGFVNCTPDFAQQPEVMNGFSETMIEVFGERGRGARSAVGTGSLPRGWAVEVEAIFELHDNL